jgi:hypothetical protein
MADIPWAIGAGLAEIGFTLESFMISCSILRCSCGWGRMVCLIAQFSHSVGRRRSPLSKGTIYEAIIDRGSRGQLGTIPDEGEHNDKLGWCCPAVKARTGSSGKGSRTPGHGVGGAEWRGPLEADGQEKSIRRSTGTNSGSATSALPRVKASKNQSRNGSAAPKRAISAAARKRMAVAQRARWAKVRARKKAA